jgi:hypothetical protein
MPSHQIVSENNRPFSAQACANPFSATKRGGFHWPHGDKHSVPDAGMIESLGFHSGLSKS